MTDWPVKTLGDVATIATGKIDVNAATENGAYPFFTCSRDVYRIDDAPFEGKAILVAGNGDLNVKYYEGRFNAYQRTYFLFARDENKCYPRYLFWFLENYLDVLRSGASGSTIKYIRLGDLSEASIAVPPLEEQKRIVALLDTATERVTELTACYEQARTHANNLFASALRDSPESDQSAPLRTLDELCEEGIVKLGRGNIISKKDIAAKPGPYPIYSSARENEGKFGEYGDYMFDEEMITWSIDGGGRLFYRPKHKFSVTNVGGTLRVLDPRLLDIQYLHRVLQNLHSQRVFDWVFKAHPSVIRKVYDAIPMPPLAEQKQIVARLDSIRAKTSEMVAAYNAKLTAAKNLRQSILEAAFAGDL